MRLISLVLLLQLVPAVAFVGSGAHVSAFVGRASTKLRDGLSGKIFQLEEREGVCWFQVPSSSLIALLVSTAIEQLRTPCDFVFPNFP
jgi:hypothetical protein